MNNLKLINTTAGWIKMVRLNCGLLWFYSQYVVVPVVLEALVAHVIS